MLKMQITPSKCANHAPGTLRTISHVQSGNAALYDNQGGGRSSFFVVQFLWDHPR